VTRAGPVLGGGRQVELVADGRDEVDADVDLVALGPVGDDALEDIVRPGAQWSQRPKLSLVWARATCGNPATAAAAAPAAVVFRKSRRVRCSIAVLL